MSYFSRVKVVRSDGQIVGSSALCTAIYSSSGVICLCLGLIQSHLARLNSLQREAFDHIIRY